MKFTKITSHAIPLLEENVDTDAIIPARFLKTTTREGFGDNLFRDWRYDENNNELPSLFNDEFYKQAHIMLTQKDFGIGSSREHAAWAIYDFGIRCVIGTSFGDIFYNNSLKNGLLIVKLKPKEIEELFAAVAKEKETQITVDLERQIVSLPDQTGYEFVIEPFRKKCLLEGVDDIGYILSFEDKISKFENNV